MWADFVTHANAGVDQEDRRPRVPSRISPPTWSNGPRWHASAHSSDGAGCSRALPSRCVLRSDPPGLALDWLSSRANNVKGGRRNTSTRTVEPVAPGAGETKHCMHATYSYRSTLYLSRIWRKRDQYCVTCRIFACDVAPIASRILSVVRGSAGSVVPRPPQTSRQTRPVRRTVSRKLGDSRQSSARKKPARLSGLIITNKHPSAVRAVATA